MKRNISPKFLLGIIYFFGGILFAQNPQDIDNNSNTDYSKHFESGVALVAATELEISVANAVNNLPNAINFTWSWCIENNPDASQNLAICSNGGFQQANEGTANTINIGYGLTATFFDGQNNRRAVISGTPTFGTNAAKFLEFTLRLRLVGNNGFSSIRNYHFVIRRSRDLVFVLDRSGSMECEALDNTLTDWPACIVQNPAATPTRRWDKLKDAIKLFADKLDESPNLNVGNDQVGVVFFSGDIANPGSLAGFNPIGTFRSNILGVMGSPPVEGTTPPRLATNGTSIGGGLNDALKNYLTGGANPTTKEIVVLFSDGEENAFPKMDNTGKLVKNASNTTIWDLGDPNTMGTVDMYTVGLTAHTGNGLSTLLGKIADPSNYFGTTSVTPTDYLNLLSTNAFNKIYSTFSPHYISFKDQQTQIHNTETFVCNQNVGRLFLEMHYESPIAPYFKYKIEKNGVEVSDSLISVHRGAYYTTYVIDFYNISNFESQGEWTFSSTFGCGLDGDRYYYIDEICDLIDRPSSLRISATADDHLLDFSASTGEPDLKVGDDMDLSVALQYRGRPLNNAEVSALIIKPGDDINDLLARTEVSDFEPSDEPENGTCATQKYAFLRQTNPAVFETYEEAVEEDIRLENRPGGVYTGTYKDVDVSGIYNIVFSVKANIEGVGQIVRTLEQTVNVRFGRVDLNIEQAGLVQENGVTTLAYRPAYISNGRVRYVGPGYAYGFGIEAENAEEVTVQDQCDGSYTIRVVHEGDPNITINLIDEEIYDGKLSGFNKPVVEEPLGLSFHTGVAIPLGSLNNTYKTGFYLEGDLSYKFTPDLALEAVGGYYSFGNDFNILGGTIYAKYELPNLTSKYAFTGLIGGGIYKPNNEEATIGYSLRLSGVRKINEQLDLSLETAFFSLPNPGYSFSIVGVGIKYRLNLN